MLKRYQYVISGTGGDQKAWSTEGTVECDFPDMFRNVMLDSIEKLQSGKALCDGTPGRCSGPHDIDTILIKQVRH